MQLISQTLKLIQPESPPLRDDVRRRGQPRRDLHVRQAGLTPSSKSTAN
jgi:hypothetical protein